MKIFIPFLVLAAMTLSATGKPRIKIYEVLVENDDELNDVQTRDSVIELIKNNLLNREDDEQENDKKSLLLKLFEKTDNSGNKKKQKKIKNREVDEQENERNDEQKSLLLKLFEMTDNRENKKKQKKNKEKYLLEELRQVVSSLRNDIALRQVVDIPKAEEKVDLESIVLGLRNKKPLLVLNEDNVVNQQSNNILQSLQDDFRPETDSALRTYNSKYVDDRTLPPPSRTIYDNVRDEDFFSNKHRF